MRALIITIMLAALCLCGCSGMSATFLGGPDLGSQANEYAARIGYGNEKTEVGVVGYYWSDSDIDEVFGVYILQSLTDPNGLGLLGRPYIGGQATVADGRGDGGMYGFITGTVLDIGGVDILTEFQWRSYSESLAEAHDDGSDKYKLFIAPRFYFPTDDI